MNHTGLGIHVALSKYPLGYEKEYITNLNSLYTKYRGEIEKYIESSRLLTPAEKEKLEELYKPAIFHVYSHFDVAFISLVDNFKFPQRVFEPHHNQGDEKIKSVSYQILSGGIFTTGKSPNPNFILQANPEFVKIIQLKINNGLLIGNGAKLFEESIALIEEVLLKTGIDKYIFVNSYNWGEITIICVNESPDTLAKALMRIRLLTIENIKNTAARDAIKTNSLYTYWGEKNITHSHLFSETLSYLGVNFNEYGNVKSTTKFNTQIEWQIKPGHFPFFAREMENSPLAIGATYKNVYFKNGKTDYLILEKKAETIGSNKKLFDILRSKHPVLSHIRKIKTKPLFNLDADIQNEVNVIKGMNDEGPCNTESNLSQYKIIDTKEVANILRKLNVSRNTRKKVNKIVYNYNLGIQDPVLYIYFIDLYNLLQHVFIRDLRLLANETEKSIHRGCLSDELKKLAKKFNSNALVPLKTVFIQEELIDVYVDVFQEALEDRILNNYNYEDINEFSLDINSSLTNLVSSLDTIIKFYGTCFRDSDGNSIITTINENETMSNKLSVNYNIEHITNVPLIFATLIKEILNVQQTDFSKDEAAKRRYDKLNEEFEHLIKHKKDDEQQALYDVLDKINFDYFEIDYKKYFLTYLTDTNLFIFWHWTYALQCTHLYNSIGYFDEISFVKELFRLLLLLKAVKPSKVDDLACPIPELRTYWDKYYNRIKKLADLIAGTEAFDDMCKLLKSETYEGLDNIDYKDTEANAKHIFSSNKIESFIDSLFSNAKVLSEKKISHFYNLINTEIDNILTNENANNKASYYRILTYISFYNLKLIQGKFNHSFSILRRDYENGNPLEHFLAGDKKWYIDPFGGFFINDITEREDYMLTNNKMLYLIWHLGIIRKKIIF